MVLGDQKKSLLLLASPHSFLLSKGVLGVAEWAAARNNIVSTRAFYSVCFHIYCLI